MLCMSFHHLQVRRSSALARPCVSATQRARQHCDAEEDQGDLWVVIVADAAPMVPALRRLAFQQI